MAFISWQAWLFTAWALSQDSYVWTHSLSPWNITFSFMFPPNSLWELNYLDWYGRVEWKWHFISGDHIWILTSSYNNSIRLSNLWTSLILTFLTEKKKLLKLFYSVSTAFGLRISRYDVMTQNRLQIIVLHGVVSSIVSWQRRFLDSSKLKRNIFSRSMRITLTNRVCNIVLNLMSANTLSVSRLPAHLSLWIVLESQSIYLDIGYALEVFLKLLFDPFIVLTLPCFSHLGQIIFFP